METETFIIGQSEYTCVRMNAFAANKILMRLQKIVLPVFGALMSEGKSIDNVDVKEAAMMLSEHLNESAIADIVFPMFAESKTYCVDKKLFIKNGNDIDRCFTTDNLFDFYELIFCVGRYQFAPFFVKIAERFGSLAEPAKK